MSPLARVAGLAAIAAGAIVAAATPAAAAPATPTTPNTQEASPMGGSPTGAQTTPEGTSPTGTPSGTQSAPQGIVPTESPSPNGTPSTQDAQFLQQSHQVNLAEIAAGQLAQQKGKNQTVKNLGAKFVTDHRKLDQSLRSVANSLGVSLPTTPNADQQAVANRLKTMSGTQFDRLFVTSQFTGHTQAMQATQNEIANGGDARVTKLASDALPVIESHHQALQNAARQLGVTLPATPTPRVTVSPMPTASPSPASS